MKKMIACFLLCAFVLAPVTASAAESDWDMSAATEITEEVQELFDDSVEKIVGAGYTPVAVLGVCDDIYCILCKVEGVYPDAKPYNALVYIDGSKREVTNIYGLWLDVHSARENGDAENVLDGANTETDADAADRTENVPISVEDFDRGKLIEMAMANQKNSYAPYSRYNVSAAVLADSGKVYLGVNVENASYPAGVCAEHNAIDFAVQNGERNILAVVIVGGPEYTVGDYCPPCGICRQVMREFSDPTQLRVITANSPTDYIEMTLEELLPKSFGPNNLSE